MQNQKYTFNGGFDPLSILPTGKKLLFSWTRLIILRTQRFVANGKIIEVRLDLKFHRF